MLPGSEIKNISKMKKFETENNSESGYSSEDDNCVGNCCGICGKNITGPRMGLIVHLGNRHIHSTLREIDPLVTVTELHLVVKIRNRAISRALAIQD